MSLEEYKREIELMRKQNFTEYDMYSIISAIIRSGSNIKSLSLRDVSNRRKSSRGQVFYGLSSIPELVILHEDFKNSDNENSNVDNRDHIYGCIEIKMVDFTLLSVEKTIDKVEKLKKEIEKNPNILLDDEKKLSIDEGQILGEVLWYRKVIYTNGIIWKLYECEYKDSYGDEIKNLVIKRINEEKDNKDSKELWYINLNFEKINIKQHPIVNIDSITNEQWSCFINELHKIDWTKRGFNCIKEIK